MRSPLRTYSHMLSEDRKRDSLIRHNLKLVDESNARTLAIIAEFEQPMRNQCTGGMANG